MAKKKIDGVTSVDVAEENSLAIPELEVFKKISMLSSLTSSVQDKELVAAFNNQEHGQKLYEIFVKAVHKEVETIISGAQAKAPAAVANAFDQANQLFSVVQTMYNMITAMSQSPIIKCLSIVNDNLAGTKMVDAIATLNAKSHAATQQFSAQQEQAANQAVQAQQPAPTPAQARPATPPVQKRYADTGQRGSGAGPAPVLPPRGNKVDGLF